MDRHENFAPRRSLFTDDFYDDQRLYFDFEENEQRIWDLEEMNVIHENGMTLVGDELYQDNHSGKGPKGYSRSDRLIHEEVCEVLKNDPEVDPSEVDVTVDKGLVFLRGEIRDREMKRKAEYAIEDIPGVKDVINEIRIQK